MYTEVILMGVFDNHTESEKLRRIVQTVAKAMGGPYHSAEVLVPTSNAKLVRQQKFLYLFKHQIPSRDMSMSNDISPLGKVISEALNEINRYYVKGFDRLECFGKFVFWLPTGRLGSYYKGRIFELEGSICPVQYLPRYSYRAQVAIGGSIDATLYIGIAKIEELRYQLAVGLFLNRYTSMPMEIRLCLPQRLIPYSAYVGQYQNCPDYAVVEEFCLADHWYRRGCCTVELLLPNSPVHSFDLYI